MKRLWSLVGLTAILGCTSQQAVIQQTKASSENENRAKEILAGMTLDEKIGQMTQVELDAPKPGHVTQFGFGSILNGGNGGPVPNTPTGWADAIDGMQGQVLQSSGEIPLIYGTDGVHGHSNLKNAVIFPHNVGLGAANDPELTYNIGRITAEELLATGVHWNFAPTVAVPQDIRWGRSYEGFSEDTAIVTSLGAAYLEGLQSHRGTDKFGGRWILGTPKHFVADGGTSWDSAPHLGPNKMDQGDARIDEETLRRIHLPPYKEVIASGAQSIMVSFSSWQGQKLHGHRYLLTDVLKTELGFDGFLISDWQAIDQLPGDLRQDVKTSINAGLDMIMVPFEYEPFISTLKSLVESGEVPMARIDDAVTRILKVKLDLGLFDHPYADRSTASAVGSMEHRAVAAEAVQKSLVLLKNDGNALPLGQGQDVLIAGRGANNIGMQCGGWTIDWQGSFGPITAGSTILDGLRAQLSHQSITYKEDGVFNQKASVGIVVIGEDPYAEYFGDQQNLRLSQQDIRAVNSLRPQVDRLVVILLSGRPLIIDGILDQADALVAAWLPGSEGNAIAPVLTGQVPFTGKLPYTWPRSMDQIPFDFDHLPTTGAAAPLYRRGHGLNL